MTKQKLNFYIVLVWDDLRFLEVVKDDDGETIVFTSQMLAEDFVLSHTDTEFYRIVAI